MDMALEATVVASGQVAAVGAEAITVVVMEVVVDTVGINTE
jgi:hypothetical protein